MHPVARVSIKYWNNLRTQQSILLCTSHTTCFDPVWRPSSGGSQTQKISKVRYKVNKVNLQRDYLDSGSSLNQRDYLDSGSSLNQRDYLDSCSSLNQRDYLDSGSSLNQRDYLDSCSSLLDLVFFLFLVVLATRFTLLRSVQHNLIVSIYFRLSLTSLSEF
jgi:hypothetical protein